MPHGTPTDYWRLQFDENAAVTGQDSASLIADIVANGTKNLFVMSHGWGNTQRVAEELYGAFFPLIAGDPRVPVESAYLGVFWPSIWFPDPPAERQAEVTRALEDHRPGAADAALSGQAITSALATSVPGAAAQLAQMGQLIDDGLASVHDGTGDAPGQQAAIDTFHTLLSQVFAPPAAATEDSGESQLFWAENPAAAYAKLAVTMGSAPAAGDTEGLGDLFDKVWNGAKDALRVASYYQMKGRAGDIGRDGLGPFLAQLHAAAPDVRVHLIGHSFGARLVSFALSGIPSPDESPVTSLSLLQGAFSHWSFAPAADTPFGEAGALSTVTDRVHGPMTATFTAADWAVGRWYPKASFLAQQDNQNESGPGRWDGMGADGYQGVDPRGDLTLPLSDADALTAGTFYRVDANGVIADTNQSSFAGAHSDLMHPEVAALVVAAARVGLP